MEGVALTLDDKHYLPQVWRNTKDNNVRERPHCGKKKGAGQSMTFQERDKIRAALQVAEVTLANLHYWPGDNNNHFMGIN